MTYNITYVAGYRIHFYTLFLVINLVVYIVASKSYAWENPSLILTYAKARPIDCNC